MGVRDTIFISYRRDQSRADARSIFQQLQSSFGPNHVFMDVDSIPRGQDFRAALDGQLKRCAVLIAVIGTGWLDSTDDRGNRRLDDPSDILRCEIAAALARNIPVIPVLVDGARLPDAKQLPVDIQGLVFRQAATIRHETFGRDIVDLLADVSGILAQRRNRWRRRTALAVAAVTVILAAAGFGFRHYRLSGDTAANALPSSRSARADAWAQRVAPWVIKVDESPSIGRADGLAKRMATISSGKLALKFMPPSGHTKAVERLDALSKGTLDAIWETPAAWSGEAPVLALFGGQVPFGLDAARQSTWLAVRGTSELDGVYQRKLGYNVKAIHCRVWPPEGMWFASPLTEPSQLAGMAIRSTSFFLARIGDKIGFRTLNLHARDIVSAFAKGSIGAAELSSPLVDFDYGLQKAAKTYYFPGIHAPTTAAFLHFNLDRWMGLDEATRGLIEETCSTQVATDIAGIADQVQRGLLKLKDAGIESHSFPPAVASAMEAAMRTVADELAAGDPDFRRIYASYRAQR